MRIDKYRDHTVHQSFISRYGKAINAATGSEVDPNANVDRKSIATLETELFKRDAIAINRLAMHQKLSQMYGIDTAEEYLRQLEEHEIYRHDETGVIGKPYCASVTLYPFLFHGNTTIGGTSEAPKNLSAFNGAFINLVFALAAQFCGAISTPEWLAYMDYFIRKEYGNDYYLHASDCVDTSNRHRTIDKVIIDAFEQVVYLQQDVGKPLLRDLDAMILRYSGMITCVCLMGEGQNMRQLEQVLHIIRSHGLKTSLYSGHGSADPFKRQFPYLDYIKLGAYKEELGGQDKLTTNQRFYRISAEQLIDETQMFQRKKEEHDY